MPTRVQVVGNTEATGYTIEADAQRTVLVVQNLDTVAGTDYLYVSDQTGQVAATGVQIAPVGGSLTLRRTHGEQPHKAFRLVAATAGCPVRIMELYGVVTVVVEPMPEEPDPQDPTKPGKPKFFDAPLLRRIPRRRTGYE